MKRKLTKNITISVILVVCGFILWKDTGVSADGQEQNSCVTAKCHATMGKSPVVHVPVAGGECTACHVPNGNEKHKFQPIVNLPELCAGCHGEFERKAVVHNPFEKGKCTACHNPHESSVQFLLKKDPVAEVCFGCHKREIMEKGFKHGPSAEGYCNVCHSPHTSDNPKLVRKEGNNLCFECHSDMKEAFASAPHIHPPAEESCLNCHNPHSNTNRYMLNDSIPQLCFTCHGEIEEHVAKSSVKHGALEIEKKCLNCHSPHQANYLKQLVDEPMNICLKCHDRPLQTEERPGTLMNMKDHFAKNPDWHGPIRDHDCTGCHNIHGGTNFRMLKRFYPREFYAPFAMDQYELCLGCHEPTLVQDSTTTTLTGFRNGDRNLHYVHVHRKVKGRTCRACHETHASQKPRHIREAVPFGNWSLPIRYEKRETGGRCSPGCHEPRQYDRAVKLTGKP